MGAGLCLLGVLIPLLHRVRPGLPSPEIPLAVVSGRAGSLASLRGQVIDAQGRGLPGTLVVAERVTPGQASGAPHGAISGQDGGFAMVLAELGVYRVILEARGWARQVRTFTAVAAAEIDLGAIPLEPEAIVAGLVLDPQGRPVPGAMVRAVSALDLEARPLEPPHRAVADGRGHFRLQGLPSGPYRLEAQAPQYGVAALSEVQAPSLDVRFTLRPLRVVAGRVLREGKGAAGAQVILVGTGAWPPRRVLADAKGAFQFEGVRQGLYQIRAVSGSWLSGFSEPLEVLGEGVVPRVTLRLLEGVFLKGRVIEQGSRQGLAGARLVLAEDALSFDPMHGTSDPAGEILLGPVLPGEYLLSVEREGYLPRQAEPLTVLPGENPRLELALELGAVIAGQVIDDTGRPVPEARIELMGRALGSHIADRDLESSRARDAIWNRLLGSLAGKGVETGVAVAPSLGVLQGPVPLVPGADTLGDFTGAEGLLPAAGRAEGFVTDAEGRFTLRGVPPGTLALVVRHPQFVRLQSEPLRLGRGEARREILLRLRPGTALVAEVVDPRGQPVANAQVAVAPEGDPFYQAVRMTDPQGFVRFPHLDGLVRVELRAAGFVSLVQRLTLGAAEGGAGRLRLVLEQANCRLEGRLFDRRQLPVVGAEVTVTSLTPDAPSRGVALSDATGTYVLEGLGRLEYGVEVAHPDHVPERFTLRCPTAAHRRTLSFGGGIAFEVRDRQTGEKVPAFQFTLSRPGEAVVRRSGAAGAAQVLPLPEGRYSLTVTALRYAPASLELDVPPSSEPRQITRRGQVVWLSLAGRVSGWVRDERGLAVLGATVVIAGREGTTDPLGRFQLDDVPAGRHELRASHAERGEGRLLDVEVQGGLDRADLVVDLDGSASRPESVVAGIALDLGEREGRIFVKRLVAASTAEQARLARGDELLAVDGRSIEGMGIVEVEGLLRGVAGTTVVLEIRREGKRMRLPVRRELLGKQRPP